MNEGTPPDGQRDPIDPITLEIIRHGLNAIPNHIDTNITRTAFSPLVFEYKDYAVGIVDHAGQLISQCKGGIPIFVANALGTAVRDGLAIYGPDGFEAGDVIMTNHAGTMGQHLNNVVMYTPILVGPNEAELLGFMAIVVHWLDVGGTNVGSCHAADTTEIFQEGIQFRTVKLMSKGERVDDIFRMIEYNTRFPKMVLGDVSAQLAGCLMGRDMVVDLVGKYGVDTVRQAVTLGWDQSERIARAAIRDIPDGEYAASAFLDSDGVTPDRTVAVGIKVRVEGDTMTVDFSGVADQVPGSLNSGFNGGAVAAARVAAKYLLTPDEPPNEGDFRPIKVQIPEGKFLSARENAPVGQSGTTLPTVVDTILWALAPAVPHRVIGAHHGTYGIHVFDGVNPATGEKFSAVNTVVGGWGAAWDRDGSGPFRSAVHGDTLEMPAELQEALYPLRLDEFGLRIDSGGPGEFRGGLGTVKIYSVLAPCSITLAIERSQCRPWGLFGGGPAASGHAEVHRQDGTVEPVLKAIVRLDEGDRVLIRSGGGGGYGPPYRREAARVIADVANGVVSRDAALADYGVALDKDLGVLESETAAARKRMSDAETNI